MELKEKVRWSELDLEGEEEGREDLVEVDEGFWWGRLAWVLLSFGGGIWGMVEGMEGGSVLGAVSHGGGRSVAVDVAVLIWTACNFLWEHFGLRRRVDLHHSVGTVLVVKSIVLHVLPRTLGMYLDDWALFTVKNPNEIRTFTTGVILFCTLITTFLSTRSYVRNYLIEKRLFRGAHIFNYFTTFSMLLIHGTPVSKAIISFPLAVYILDRTLRILLPPRNMT